MQTFAFIWNLESVIENRSLHKLSTHGSVGPLVVGEPFPVHVEPMAHLGVLPPVDHKAAVESIARPVEEFEGARLPLDGGVEVVRPPRRRRPSPPGNRDPSTRSVRRPGSPPARPDDHRGWRPDRRWRGSRRPLGVRSAQRAPRGPARRSWRSPSYIPVASSRSDRGRGRPGRWQARGRSPPDSRPSPDRA